MNDRNRLSRRAALAGALALAPAATAAALPAGDDAELIALGKECETAYAVLDAMHGVADDVCYRAADRCCEITQNIEGIRARTIAGLRVKMRAIRLIHNDEPETEIPEILIDCGDDRPCKDVRLARSILADLLCEVVS